MFEGIRKAEINGRILSAISIDHISFQAHRISTASFNSHSRVRLSTNFFLNSSNLQRCSDLLMGSLLQPTRLRFIIQCHNTFPLFHNYAHHLRQSPSNSINKAMAILINRKRPTEQVERVMLSAHTGDL
jgi:hypothetical protein